MDEPGLRISRLALAGGLATILIVGGAGFMAGRKSASPPTTAVPQLPAIVPVAEPNEPKVKPPVILDRRDLIALAASAADAAASGESLPDEVQAAGGRRFDLRLPFGCSGPAPPESEAAMRWRFAAKEGVLRVHVAPIAWNPENWWGGAVPAGVEVIEGYWIARPWTTSEACPPGPEQLVVPDAESGTLPEQTLAIVQLFADEEGRQARRDGRPFSVVQRMSEQPANLAGGLRLRLRGRVASGLGGGPILCQQPAGPQQRPICAIAVEFDQVAIEAPDGTVLGTWDVGQSAATGTGG